jgi:hypothetical protein
MMKKIDTIPGGNPFKVPDNYFEDVKRKIVLSTSEKGVEVRKPDAPVKLRTLVHIAASVAVFCALTLTGLIFFSQHENKANLSVISSGEFPPMLLEEIDITSLEENITLDGVPAMGYKVESNDIIDYLLSDNIDISEIEGHFYSE